MKFEHLGKDLYVYITRNDDGEIVVWRIGGLSEGTLQVLSEKEVVIY